MKPQLCLSYVNVIFVTSQLRHRQLVVLEEYFAIFQFPDLS